MTEMEEFPLEEMFQMNTKKELITAAKLLDIRIRQNERKAEIATQKKGIEKGLKDIDEGRVIPHAVPKTFFA